jgi:hypothetical protein
MAEIRTVTTLRRKREEIRRTGRIAERLGARSRTEISPALVEARALKQPTPLRRGCVAAI